MQQQSWMCDLVLRACALEGNRLIYIHHPANEEEADSTSDVPEP